MKVIKVFENVKTGLQIEINEGILSEIQIDAVMKQVDEDGVRLFKEVKTSKAKLEKE